MKRLLLFALVASGSFLASVGCNHNPRPNPQACPQPVPFPVGPGPGPVMAPLPKGTQFQPDSSLPPPAPIGSQSNSMNPLGYQDELAWKPGPGSGGPSVRLYPPEVAEESDGGVKTPLYPPDGFGSGKPAPPKVEESVKPMESAASFPVGISQYTLVRDKIANGLRPSLDDGLDWLQANGYQTVLFLHEPGAPDGADRKQVEKRGMRFVALEVSPMTLAQKNIDDFNRIVGDSAVLPLFVYDRDGSLTGGMWYLNFRLTQQASDETARNQARPLGYRDDRDGAHREMWQATQRVLADRMR